MRWLDLSCRSLLGRGSSRIRPAKVAWGCRLFLSALVLAIGASAPQASAAAEPQSFDDLDTLLDLDPTLTIPPPKPAFDPRLAPLWTSALNAPEADLRRRAAQTIVTAHALGMPGLDVAIPNLEQVVVAQDEAPLVKLTAAEALVALEARQAANGLFALTKAFGDDAAEIVAPALARWDYAPAREVWLRQLADSSTMQRPLVTAIRGLGQMKATEAEQLLSEVMNSPARRSDVRLTAARALAQVRASGLEAQARQLAQRDGSAGILARLMAASLLRDHQGDAAREVLSQLARDEEPTVANLALERLIEIAPERVAELAPELVGNRDANVRRWAVSAVAQFPTEPHVVLLADAMNDPHPQIRILARDSLLKFAREHGLREKVLAESVRVLGGEDWRGLEQAARIVGTLDHKVVAPRLIELLEHSRREVNVTVAWGLRRFAMPDTLPAVFDFATRMTDKVMKQGYFTDYYDPQFSQVFQLFGVLKYQEADPLLRRYVPKLSMSNEARGAAIWSLGHIHAANPPEDLVRLLEQRLADAFSQPPEMERVRQMSAISLGRMKAEIALPTLRKFYEMESSQTRPGYASGWAVAQITGEEVKKPQVILEYRSGWFLVPQ